MSAQPDRPTFTLADVPDRLLTRDGSRKAARELHDLCVWHGVRPTYWQLRQEAERRGLVKPYDSREYGRRRAERESRRKRGQR